MKLLIHSQNCTVEVWILIQNLISHFTGHVITYPCSDQIPGMIPVCLHNEIINHQSHFKGGWIVKTFQMSSSFLWRPDCGLEMLYHIRHLGQQALLSKCTWRIQCCRNSSHENLSACRACTAPPTPNCHANKPWATCYCIDTSSNA